LRTTCAALALGASVLASAAAAQDVKVWILSFANESANQAWDRALANEYDFLLNTKPMSLWDRFCHILEENDPNGHLRSIHNGDQSMSFDHRKPWITHVCIQNWDVKRTPEWRLAYGKPVVNDEPEYEGNIYPAWGNITAQELTHRLRRSCAAATPVTARPTPTPRT
jgi:hypothetical protein